ncbi:MAG: hypothetical protein K4305_06950 [Chlorobium sp.]|uniref:hypothetical protein n=1 Tax=Chlorobium sp. TaxID=1095 RepID=UPI002F410084
MNDLPKELVERINLFEENYDLKFSHLPSSPKVVIGDKTNGCRFAVNEHPEQTFKQVAHALPEAIGNKSIICAEECDSCNHFFSEHVEVHYDKLAKVYRQIAQIKGKKKVPSYKTKDKRSRIDVSDRVMIKQTVGSNMVEIDQEGKTVTINYEIEPYVPAAVYKTLVKMALSVMPRPLLDSFEAANRWICNPDHTKDLMTPLMIDETFIPGPRPNPSPAALLLTRKDSCTQPFPHCIFVLAYGNIVQQIMVPSSADVENIPDGKMRIPRFPTPFEVEWEYGGIRSCSVDYTSTDLLRGRVLPVTMSFEGMEEIPTDSNELKKYL